MQRREFLAWAGSAAVLAATGGRASGAEKADRLNVVLIIGDDISWDDLGCYGHPTIHTPNCDRMAKEGLRFTNAYLPISSCSPSRCCLITGRYAHNTGAAELHTTLPVGQVLFPKLLRDAGYYTALSGKNHMGKYASTAFEKITGGGGGGGERDWVSIIRDRPKDKPFLCWFASYDAHRGWSEWEGHKHDPKDVVVPPYLFDGPATRADLAQYYDEVARLDNYTGAVMAELKRQGIAENTLVIYMADNGRPFPRGKTHVYDSGMKTPFLAWWPGKIRPGGVADGLVSSIDISATVLSLAGVAKDKRIQGVDFGPMLTDPKAKVRDYVFAEHNWHVFQNHERMVRHGDWMYIRNALPAQRNLCLEDTRYPASKELWEQYEKGNLTEAQSNIMLKPRPAEELYDVRKDPDQLTNLAGKPEHAAALTQMRAILDLWTEQTRDSVPKDLTGDRDRRPGAKTKPRFKRGTQPGGDRGAEKANHPGPVRAK